MNLTQRTTVNAAFNTMSWALPMGLNFFILPYIVSTLGADNYGILTLVLTVIGYFAFLDLGLGNAVIKFVAEFHAMGDFDRMNDFIGAIFFVLLAVGTIGGLGILSIARPLASSFLKMPPHLISAARGAFYAGSLGFVLTVMLSFVSAIPNALNRYDITSLVSVAMGGLTMAGTACLLFLGFRLLAIVWFNVCISALGITAYVLIIKSLAPEIRLKPALRLTILKRVFSYGFFSVLSRISYLVNYQADRLVTGTLLGIGSVTYYFVPFTLVNRVTSITVRIGSVIFPAVSGLQGQNRHEKILELYYISSRVILLVSTAICLPLTIFGPRFLRLWMGADFGRMAGQVMMLVTLGLYLSALTNIPSFVVEGLGMPRISGTAAICGAFINIALAIPLAMHMGIVGVSIAFLISNAAVTPAFIWYVNRKVLKIPQWEMLREAYARPLAAGFAIMVPLLLIPQARVNNLFLMLVVLALSSSFYLAVSYWFGAFPAEVDSMVRVFFRKSLKRIVGTAA